MKKFLWKLIKSSDIFGVPIHFTLSGKYDQKSHFGGVLTFVLIVIFFILFLQSLLAFVNHSDFSVYTQDIYYKNPPNVNLESNKLNFLLTFNDQRLNNNSYFNIELFQTISYYNETDEKIYKNKKTLKTEKCTLDHFRDDLKNDFSNLDLNNNISNFICGEKNFEYKIRGTYLSSDFSYFNVKISACSTNEEVKCAPKEEIDRIFNENRNKIYFNIFLSNNIINSNDFEKPVTSYVEDKIYVIIDRNYYKEKNFFLTKNQIFTDQPILLSEISLNYDTYIYNKNNNDETTILIDPDSKETSLYASLYFRSDPMVKNHFRAYQRLSKYISYIGGFWSLLYFIFSLIGKSYNLERTQIKIANKLFEFDKTSPIKSSLKKKRALKFNSKMEQISPFNFSNQINRNREKDLSNSSGILQKIKIFLESHKTFKLLYYCNYFFKYLLARNHVKIQDKKTQRHLRNLAKKTLQKDFDIVCLLQKIKSFVKFKNLLLNKDQNFIFEFFEKEVLQDPKKSRSRSSQLFFAKLSKNKVLNEKLNGKLNGFEYLRLYNSYVNLKNDNSKLNKRINQKIIEEIKPELLQIFLEEEEKSKNNYRNDHFYRENI